MLFRSAGKQGFQLIPTKPLPAIGSVSVAKSDAALWLMELEDGVWCSPFTGANPEFNGQNSALGVSRLKYVAGRFEPEHS